MAGKSPAEGGAGHVVGRLRHPFARGDVTPCDEPGSTTYTPGPLHRSHLQVVGPHDQVREPRRR